MVITQLNEEVLRNATVALDLGAEFLQDGINDAFGSQVLIQHKLQR